MSGDTFDFTQGARDTLRGTLHDPAATSGDVLTVQADGSVAAAPGGGSMPGAPFWKGPYTLTPADYAEVVNGVAEIAAPTDVPYFLVGAAAFVTEQFSGSATPGNDGFYVTVGDPSGSISGGDPEFQNIVPDLTTPGVVQIPYQPGQLTFPAPGSVIGGNALIWLVTVPATGIGVYFDAIPDPSDTGSVDVYLCFAKPAAP